MIRLRINVSGLDKVREAAQRIAETSEWFQEDLLNACEDHIVPMAQALAPVRTGALKASIEAMSSGDLGVSIVATAPYAAFVELGTRSHDIFPRNKSVLSWVDRSGARVFARRVRHPGTQPKPFLKPAVDEGIGQVLQEIATRFMELWNE